MSQNEEFALTKGEIDIIGEVSNISMGAAATALSNIIGQKVIITSPKVEKGTDELAGSIEKIPSIGVVISYTEGVVGDNFLIMRAADAGKIVSHLMGGEVDENTEFGELQLSAVAEVMNQMMGGAATALSGFIERTVNISPPSAFVLTDENKKEKLAAIYEHLDSSIFVRFQFTVESMFQSEIFMVMTHDFEKELVDAMLRKMGVSSLAEMETGFSSAAAGTPSAAAEAPDDTASAVPPAPEAPAQAAQEASASQSAGSDPNVGSAGMFVPPSAEPSPDLPPQKARREAAAAASARPAVLPNFSASPELVLNPDEQSNFELIQNVPLELSVEVGRARKLVREVLDLTTGSIVELDKQAGDPVDIIVNGQMIAHGEVVVIDESFGVRITEILGKKQDRK